MAIDALKVTAVLLADGWHETEEYGDEGTVFELVKWEFIDTDKAEGLTHDAGAHGICPTGFQFIDKRSGDMIAGPLTSIIAVRHETDV